MCLDERWKQTMDEGKASAHACTAWDAYDLTIQSEVTAYNVRFADTPGYTSVDWKLLKAMVWVESGGPKNAAWTTRPMQIGNNGDPGYATLKNQKEASTVIMSENLKTAIATGDINTPILNVRAGIAYLFTRMALSEMKSVYDSTSSAVLEYSVQSNDNFTVIAKKVGSTVAVLRQLNSTLTVLHHGDKVKYRKARIERVITGWRKFTTKNIAERYNQGDACYEQKLDYVLNLINAH